MGLQVAFLFIYIALSFGFPAETVCSVLIAHTIINLITDIRNGRKLYLMTVYYIGITLITLSNLLYIIKVSTVGITEYSMYKYIIIGNADVACSVWAIGNASIYIGYKLFDKKSFPSIMLNLRSNKAVTNLFIFIITFAFLNFTGNAVNFGFITGGITKVLSLMNVMGIMFFARLWVVENNNKYKNYAIVLAVLQTLIALYTAFLRIELLTPAISFFGGYFIGKGSIKYVFSARIIPVIVVLAVFSTFFNTLAGNRAHFIEAFTGSDAPAATYADISDSEDKGEGGAFERSANIAQLTNVVELVKKNGYYQGKASYPLLAAFVPRILWPDKPAVQLGVWFALEIGAATIGDNGFANNSINMSIPGELYLDFGWVGVILGGLIFGALIAMFWNASGFVESPYNLSGTLWGGYLLLYALNGIGADLQIVVSLISTYIIFLLIKKIANRNENISNRPALEGQ